MRVARYAIAADLPRGWEAQIYRRAPEAGETSNPVLHAASFPLPPDRGDYGSGAVDRMGTDDVFVSLVEFDPEASATALFRRRGIPTPRPADFSPAALQRTLKGQSGCQYFFSDQGRAFCLYIVLGSHARRAALMPRVHALVGGLTVGRREGTTR